MLSCLEGVRVVDLTHVLAGPHAAWQLAMLGADVIKVESRAHPDCSRGRGPDDAFNAEGRGLTYQVQGTNKRAVALDLRKDEGRTVLLDLVRRSDVLIENLRPGAMEALGLGKAALLAANPSLVHCSLTGFGEAEAGGESERGSERAYDNVIQATAGIISRCGGIKPAVSFVDYAAGYAAALAVTAALVRKAATGHGCCVSVSMFEAALSLMAPEVAAALHPHSSPRPKEAGLATYEAADGKLVTFGVFTAEQHRRFWAALAVEGEVVPESFQSVSDWQALWSLNGEMADRLAEIVRCKRSACEWQTWLRERQLAGCAVRPLEEALKDPQLAARGFILRAGDGDNAPLVPGVPYRFDDGEPPIKRHAPAVGEHTDEVLSNVLGYSAEAINELKQKSVI